MRMTDEEHTAYLKRRVAVGKAAGLVIEPAPAPNFANEGDFRSWVLDLADRNGWLRYSVLRSDKGKVAARGFPDVILVRAGVMIAAELKCEDVKTMPLAQTRWLAELSCVPGVRAVLWQPADAENIIRQLEGAT